MAQLKETTLKALNAYIEKLYGEDAEFTEDLEQLRQAKTASEIVDVFINLAWDLETFVAFVKNMKLNREDSMELVWEAVEQQDGWST